MRISALCNRKKTLQKNLTLPPLYYITRAPVRAPVRSLARSIIALSCDGFYYIRPLARTTILAGRAGRAARGQKKGGLAAPLACAYRRRVMRPRP